MGKTYDVVVPINVRDEDTFFNGIKWLLRYLPLKKIVLIGNEKVKENIPDEYVNTVEYVDENSIITFEEVKSIIREVSGDDPDCIKRTGWYYQQFLKMKYADICTDEWYIVWDSDTCPIKSVKLFDEKHPIFDVKTEYYKPYFDTMHKILPELNKLQPFSFISEHMLISCEIMKKMISEIEQNQNIGNPGDLFYKKILKAIDKKALASIGFSEFETYGTYCIKNYPGLYEINEWHSLREAKNYFKPNEFSEREARWLKEYDAVTFEKRHEYVLSPLKGLFKNRIVQRTLPFEQMQKIDDFSMKIKRSCKTALIILKNHLMGKA